MKTQASAITLIAALALAGCGKLGSEVADLDRLDQLEARTLILADFDKIRIKGDAAVIVNTGDEFSVTLYTEDDHFDELEVFVDNGVLILEHDRSHFSNANVALEVTMPALELFRVEGATDARLNDLNQKTFEMRLAGAGNIEISGTCEEAEIEMAGAGSVSARDFKCEDVEAEMAGAGSIEIYASNSIDINVAGIGSVEVWGNPTDVRRRVGGLGTVDIH